MTKFNFIHTEDKSRCLLLETDSEKILINENYNFIFDKKTGFFGRWGKTKDLDVDEKLGLPEIADIEISTICSGVEMPTGKHTPCKFCYKNNTSNGKYMSLETFKIIFSKLPKTITQIAFGIGDISANPDMWNIFEHCRNNGVIPNVTINCANMTSEIYNNLVKYCGAVACSIYNKELTYNSVYELTKLGMNQVNIHCLLSEETYLQSISLLNDIKTDVRLKKLNAVVFLSLKNKGRAEKNNFKSINQDSFSFLVDLAFKNDIAIGFDSCSAVKFLNAIKNNKNKEFLSLMTEPCESSIFSSYINVDGNYFPCSFIENTENWEKGLSVLECKDFLKDIWNNEKTINFRNKVINCRNCKKACPVYEI